MGKTYKDRRVKILEEKQFGPKGLEELRARTPKVFNDKYKREKINLKDVRNDADDDAEEEY